MRRPTTDEFVTLPWYNWDARPETVPLSEEEAETALFLAQGDIKRAADVLKVTPARLNKVIRKSYGLQRLIAALAEPSG
jgi:hypothetical protein